MAEVAPEGSAPLAPVVPTDDPFASLFGNPALEALKAINKRLPPVASVYHYTDANAFKNAIEKGTLWFTDAAFLNDGSETTWGFNLCEVELDKFMKRKSAEQRQFAAEVMQQLSSATMGRRAAVFCASEENNLLNQWRDYGREKVAYSIGLEVVPLYSNPNSTFPVVMGRMIYDPKKQARALRSVFRAVHKKLVELNRAGTITPDNRSILVAHAAAEIMNLLSWFKNPGFSAEKEIRVMLEIPNILASNVQVQFRPGQLGLVPYFEWQWDKITKRLPLTGVTVGPSPHGPVAAMGAKIFLQASGYSNIEPFYSTIPLR